MQDIYLRPLEEEDIPLLETWLHKNHIAKWFADPEDWIAEVKARQGDFSWIHHFIAMQNDRPLGFCQYYDCYDAKEDWYDISRPGETFSLDYLIGDIDDLGKGHGKKIVALILDQIRSHSAAQWVLAQPDGDNNASAGVLLADGFAFDTEKDYYVKRL